MHPIVIIGSGLAGYTLARELRKLNKDIPITIVTADDGASYSKPLLSSALASGKSADQLAMASSAQMAEQLRADIRTHTKVTAIQPSEHRLCLGEESLTYSALVLAVGAQQKRLPLAGDATDKVLSVNDLKDYARFREALGQAKSVALIGAGLIGCEFANDLATAGYRVQLVAWAAMPLENLVPPQVSAGLPAAFKAAGVEWHPQTSAVRADRSANGLCVTLTDGTVLECDLALTATGLQCYTQLAIEAGLHVGRGITVDRMLRCSAPNIYALGDCAEVEGLVLPYVLPLMSQARALAKTLSGEPTAVSYPVMPIVVKTPAYPIVAVPPPPGLLGEWRVVTAAGGVRALFHDATGKLTGFALGGAATAEKAVFAKQIPSLLN